MATRRISQLIDDIDGNIIPEDTGKSISFSIDGRGYEIDLSDRNADRFFSAIEPYVAAARRTSTTTPSRQRPAAKNNVDLAAVRAWARENGHNVSDRGRVPQSIIESYSAVS